ncbi:MAG: flagellar protein FlaG [Zoogloeaceae bacterium]|nr:flagellar protein FlaG [Zoogloeaceae bacterium]
MDITSIGAVPVTPLATTATQGRAPTAPVSRETLATGVGGNADGARQQEVSPPVVGREQAGATGWDRAQATEVQERQAKEQKVEAEEVVPRSPQEAAEQQKKAEEETRQKVREGVKNLNEFIKPYNTSLAFSVDEESGRVVVKVTDNDTKEVIRQLPSEEALALAKALDKLKGLLIHQKA